MAPEEVSTRDIILGVTPFVAMHAPGLVMLFFVPEIATWPLKAVGW